MRVAYWVLLAWSAFVLTGGIIGLLRSGAGLRGYVGATGRTCARALAGRWSGALPSCPRFLETTLLPGPACSASPARSCMRFGDRLFVQITRGGFIADRP